MSYTWPETLTFGESKGEASSRSTSALTERRHGIEYPIWSAVHGLAVLTGPGPLRDIPDATRRHLEELTFAFIGEALA
jgi:hypothetical protein